MKSTPRWMATGLAGLIVLAACSKKDEGNPFPANDTKPPNTGLTCDDRAGDMSTDPGVTGGNLAEPAGLDILHAEAKVSGTSLKVSFTTAAPITAVEGAEIRLGQGQITDEGAFELRAAPAPAPAQSWNLSLVRFNKTAQGRVSENPPTVLPVPVRFEGNTTSYEVNLTDLPRIASYVWLLGTTNGNVTDLCEGGTTAGTAAPSTGPIATTPPTEPPRTRAPIGETLTFTTGSVVTVYAVESPPATPQPGTTPPDPGYKLAIADVQVCAPAAKGTTARKSFFYVKDSENRNLPVYVPSVVPPRVPAFPDSTEIPKGECQRAWVTFEIEEAANPTAILYSPDATGVGGLRFDVG